MNIFDVVVVWCSCSFHPMGRDYLNFFWWYSTSWKCRTCVWGMGVCQSMGQNIYSVWWISY